METTIVTIGNADKGGYWFAVGHDRFPGWLRDRVGCRARSHGQIPQLRDLLWEWDRSRFPSTLEDVANAHSRLAAIVRK